MSRLRTFLSRLLGWLGGKRRDADLRAEIDAHIAEAVDELTRQGMSPAEARHEALRQFGGVTQTVEAHRERRRFTFFSTLGQDLRYAIRSLRRHPGFTLTALTTLGLAIGLNTSLATLATSLLWQPWAVPDPAAVVQIYKTSAVPPGDDGDRRHGEGSMEFLLADYQSLGGRAKLTDIFATNCGRDLRMKNCEVQLDAERTLASFVSGNYFSTLQIPIAHGRAILPPDNDVNAPRAVAVVSHGLWQRRFASDPDIVGREITIDALPFTVIGVTAPEFAGPAHLARDVWVPMATGGLLRPSVRSEVWVEMGGRLRHGVTRGQAEGELQSIFQPVDGRPTRLHLVGTSSFARPNDRRELYAGLSVMFAGVLLVLLLACANVGNLLLARMLGRGREIAVRASLGASRARIIRQLLTEGLVLSVAASLVGLWVAWSLPTFLFESALGETHHLAFGLKPDLRVLAFACGLAAITCLAFGLAPALFASRSDLVAARRDQSGRGSSRLRAVLLGTQIAASIVPLCAASLLVRGLQQAHAQDRGLAVHDLTAITFRPPASHTPARIGQFASDFIDSIGELDSGHRLTMMARGLQNNTLRATIDSRKPGKTRSVGIIEISPNFFDVTGIQIVTGRPLSASDAGQDAVVISQALAQEHWPMASAVGKSLIERGAVGVTEHRIVGVAGNADATGETRVGEEPPPVIYRLLGTGAALHGRRPGEPILGLPEALVRGDIGPSLNVLKARAAALDSLVLVHVETMTERLDARLGESRFMASIAGVLGGLALSLAAIGVFGVFAFIVRQQSREIGVRIALGATPVQIIRGVIAFGARPVVLGVVLGLAGALLAAQMLRASLLGLSPFDPWAYLSVMAALAATGGLALLLPAWRAVRVNPVVALRSE